MTTNFARLRYNELLYSLPLKALLAAVGLRQLLAAPSLGLQVVVAVYAALLAGSTLFFFSRAGRNSHSTLPYGLSQLSDVLFVTALVALGEGIATPIFLFYPVLALKALVYGPDAPWLMWLPFLYGPLYAVGLALAARGWGFLADTFFLTRYGLLLLLTVGITGASLVLAGRLREVDRLRVALAARSDDLAAQARTLQRTATDLGDRVLQLRTLQEVAKALSSTLFLTDTLRTVAERLSRLVESPYCAVLLLDSEGESLDMLATPGNPPQLLADKPLLSQQIGLEAALRSARSQTIVLTPEARQPGNVLAVTAYWPATMLEVTPMLARGQAIGALLVGAAPDQADGALHRSLAESFAYFAAAAIENARLYNDASDKRRELEAVLAGIGDGVLVVDTAGRLVLINPVAARLFALEAPAPDAVLRDLLASDDLAALLEETAAAGEVAMRELAIAAAGTASDGQPRTFQALAAPLFRAGDGGEQVGGVVVVLRDITAQKELERMKSNFLSVVSHELKTPLHSIKGFVDIILMGKTGPVTDIQRDFLGTVQEQTGHLQRMIEDLLEFSRLESGQIRLRPIPLQPAELIGTVVDKLTPLAGQKGLALAAPLPAALPEVEADAMRLEQVLTNLVENAIKFTPTGGQVAVRAWAEPAAVQFAVLDSGIGVPKEERERIFERFYQVDSSARRRYKGTGLGLTICRHIVTQHGGQIWVDEAAGGGSEFRFWLPLQFAHDTNPDAALDFGALHPRQDLSP